MNLGSESSFLIADRLIAIGVPIVFATGYGKNIEFPERFARVPVVSKPYNPESLMPKIADALRRAAKTAQGCLRQRAALGQLATALAADGPGLRIVEA